MWFLSGLPQSWLPKACVNLQCPGPSPEPTAGSLGVVQAAEVKALSVGPSTEQWGSDRSVTRSLNTFCAALSLHTPGPHGSKRELYQTKGKRAQLGSPCAQSPR